MRSKTKLPPLPGSWLTHEEAMRLPFDDREMTDLKRLCAEDQEFALQICNWVFIEGDHITIGELRTKTRELMDKKRLALKETT